MSTFVSVGNATQPFNRLLDAVCALAPNLSQPVFVQYGSASGFDCPACETAAFVGMQEFEQRVDSAELLILHAGAGSVIHALQAGKAPVLMPRRVQFGEHVDDHQVEFAHELEATRKAVVCEEAGQLAASIAQALEWQREALCVGQEPALVGMVRAILHGQGGSE